MRQCVLRFSAASVLAAILLMASIDVESGTPQNILADPTSIVSDTFYLGYTYHDFGERKSRRAVAVDDSGRIHIAWVYQPMPLTGYSTGAYYNSILQDQVEFASPGCYVGQGLGIYTLTTVTMDVDTLSPVLVRTVNQTPQIQHRYPDTCAWTLYGLIATSGGWFPAFSIQRQSPSSLYHLLGGAQYSFGNVALSYWRTPIGPANRRTVLSTDANEWEIATSPVSLRAAIVVSRSTDIVYFESTDGGVTWGGGGGFGTMHSLGVQEPGTALSVAYDYADVLHILYESHTGSRGVTLKHWSQPTGITAIAGATWEFPSIETETRTISYPQLGVGEGDHENYLYALWSQFGKQGDNSDTSAQGISNADLYLSISHNGGISWDSPRNVTNTPSPDCNGDCWSEIVPSLAVKVDSFLYVRYTRDLRSGISTGDTLTRSRNPVYGMRIHTPDPVSAPRLSGIPSQIGPLYMKFVPQESVEIQVENPGTAPLDFVVKETEPWLSFSPEAESVYATVQPGGAPFSFKLAVDAFGLTEGVHYGVLSVTSNDPTAQSVEAEVVVDRASNIVANFRIGSTAGTDCWGWTAPDGNEYALMGTANGITVIDATRRTIVTTVPGPGPCGPSWRDIKTYRHYAYAVSECTGLNEGMMVIDLQYLPDSVHFLGAYAPLSNDQSHNLTIDTAKGYAYLAGPSTSGVWTRSLINPESPVHVFSMPNECHDLFARNDTLWVAEGNGGAFSVWNVANKTNPTLITRISIPSSGYVHNVWISADGTTAATTEETPSKTIKFWDISDLTNVQLRGQYVAASGLAHNVHIEDNFAVIAHYTSGVKVLDISDPTSPVLIESFDTPSVPEAAVFDGCWGVYPHTNNGWVYASNMDGNFYILQFDELMTTCDCPCHADPQCDGIRSNVQDVVAAIDIVFRSTSSTPSPDCPRESADVNCSGVADIVDVVRVIDVAFRGVSPAAAYCDPCL